MEDGKATPEQLRRSWVAARLAGVAVQNIPTWCTAEGLPTGSKSSFERAVGPVRAASPLKGDRGRPGKRKPKSTPLLKDWLLVDERALGARKMLYRLPNDGKKQRQLILEIRGLPGVRQILETGSDRELIVVALLPNWDAAVELRETLEGLDPERSVRMDSVDFEDHLPAVQTWRHLAEAS